MSGDPKQEYFSDGLSEELLNSLAAVRELHVAARTSAFSFKGKSVDIAEIARELNVGAILEGSVRKEGEHVRVTAQLIDATTGFHLWSKTYDRNLKGVLTLQAELASAVSSTLAAMLLGVSNDAVDQGGTDNPAAFDLYLRAQQLLLGASFEAGVAGYVADISAALKGFATAIELDPHYANAHARLAICYTEIQREAIGAVRESRKAANDALAAANHAVQLAPNVGFTHAVLADILAELFYDFAGAKSEYERALDLAPGDVRVLTRAPLFLAQMGQQQQALSYAQRAVALDPLDIYALAEVESVLLVGRRYEESLQIARRMAQLQPAYPSGEDDIYVRSGDLASALKFCTAPPIKTIYQFCAAIVYHKLNRRAEAEDIFKVYQTEAGEASAYQFAEIYSQWGDKSKALEWIETAYRLKDPGLVNLKTDALMDPVRQQPRFQAVMRELKFP